LAARRRAPTDHSGPAGRSGPPARLLRVARVGAPVAAVAVVVAGLLPWTVSGEAVRNSFATVRSARLLGIGDHAVITAVLGAWFFVPAVAGLACLAAVVGRNRLAGIGAAVVGGAALVAATAVRPAQHGRRTVGRTRRRPDRPGRRTRPGRAARLATVGALVRAERQVP
jgi:hypothetical protein